MKKEYRILKNYEFAEIIQHRDIVKCPSFICYYELRKQEHARVGISVGKKIGNAVVRNKVKRQVRSMVDSLYSFDENYDIIIIVRPLYLKKTYSENLDEISKVKKRIEKRIASAK